MPKILYKPLIATIILQPANGRTYAGAESVKQGFFDQHYFRAIHPDGRVQYPVTCDDFTSKDVIKITYLKMINDFNHGRFKDDKVSREFSVIFRAKDVVAGSQLLKMRFY